MIWEVSCVTHESSPAQRAALFIKPRLRVLDLQRDLEICAASASSGDGWQHKD